MPDGESVDPEQSARPPRKPWALMSQDERDELHQRIVDAIRAQPDATDRAIARMLGNGHRTVGKVRKRFFRKPSTWTTKIQAQRKNIEDLIREDPSRSDREIERITGVNHHFVGDLRKRLGIARVVWPEGFLKAHREASAVRTQLIAKLDQSFANGPLGVMLKQCRVPLKRIGLTPDETMNKIVAALFPEEFASNQEVIDLMRKSRNYRHPENAGLVPSTVRGSKRMANDAIGCGVKTKRPAPARLD